MKKGIILSVFVFLVVLLFAHFSFAYSKSTSKFFGGRIINTKATQIEILESTHNCVVLGTTIEINPVKGPSSYFIPAGVISATKNKADSGQLILGKYGNKTQITCTLKTYPFTTTTVSLDTVNYYGTSKN